MNPELHYLEFVASRLKSGSDVLATLTPEQANLIHLAMGISGEAGELLDAIKKHVIYNKPLDRDNVVEELGDLEFYMAGLRNSINASRAEVIHGNQTKLEKRYPSKYSDKDAQERKDKQ